MSRTRIRRKGLSTGNVVTFATSLLKGVSRRAA